SHRVATARERDDEQPVSRVSDAACNRDLDRAVLSGGTATAVESDKYRYLESRTQQQILQKKEDAARIALGRLPAAKHYWTPLASCSRSRRARPASNLWEKPGTSSMRAENSR